MSQSAWARAQRLGNDHAMATNGEVGTAVRPTLLLVDDAAETTQLFARMLEESMPCRITTASHVEDVPALLDSRPPFDAAIVDLSFAHQDGSGLDVLVDVAGHDNSTLLIVLTTGDGWAIDLLRVAWEALPLATAISKTGSIDHQIRSIERVLAEGSAPVDGVLRASLPDRRNPYCAASEYRRLVHHVGHAKLWRALLQSGPSVEYADLAAITGLSLNTLRNYRAALLPDLSLHGLEVPTMAEMRTFAHLCRPLLLPFIALPNGSTPR